MSILSPKQIEKIKKQLEYRNCRCHGRGSYWRNPSDPRFEDYEIKCEHPAAEVDLEKAVKDLIDTVEHLIEIGNRSSS